ncbi:coproporphyrinogen III oxidase [Bacillus aquiflavi]|uniref:Coproporphyrinogen III oxidase n=1 Tax=Bacillus aquiflavi TaxID=2672567 RepID=A0A6B3VUM5_9BACI|nr:coproporphyrinogen III oxidase [Bacillus aquiflavi]MBA4535649.1 coproporphyrinogen III oxidase [Bacillus aquiflavi]NEY80025.1 coproporphyrinogen III oxidase [Bacillus aquiflavi]
MQIQINGLSDVRFHRSIQLITNLFFEQCQVSFSPIDGKQIVIELQMKTLNNMLIVYGQLTDLQGKNHFASIEKTLRDSNSEKEHFKQIKNAVLHVYLTLLQDSTGIIQKWGILTGVRPTKLLHQKIQAGINIQKAHHQLQEEYLISDEKLQLMERILQRQHTIVPDLYKLRNEVSIYIGIPFCPTKCAYCTFPAYAINGRQGSVNSFLGGLHYEMEKVGEWLKEKGIRMTTVYFGGGTPTSITAEEMDRLYEKMYHSFPYVNEIREITVEAGRPDTITTEKIAVLKKWNIHRISINPQSYIQDTLKAIGRHHTVEETIDKFHLARKMGMNNINMDLIIGLPGEGINEFAYTLAETKKLMPESLTVHTLSFKRASEMTKNKDKYKVASREEVKEMMAMAELWTKDNGYVPYYLYRQKNILGNLENVGYSLPGQESIYNIMIMEELQTIIGLGCGASSKFIHPQTGEITQLANPKDPKSYYESYKTYTEKKITILNQLFRKENTLAN